MKRLITGCCISCMLILLGCSMMPGGSGADRDHSGLGKTITRAAETTGESGSDGIMTGKLVSVRDYGAVGDGLTDDTKAIQTAVSSDDTIYFPPGDYKISKPILITGKSFWSLYGQDACFDYTGEDYAFRINAADNCRIEIGAINAENGGGIEFYSEDTQHWHPYVPLMFTYIQCATDCIYVRVTGGWCNENQVYGGRFAAGENGVRIEFNGRDVINGWKFYNCGIEGVENGFLLDAGKGYVANISVINARYAESFHTILKTIGRVQDCLWVGTHTVSPEQLSCSDKTNRFEILAPIGKEGHRGCITEGKLMVEETKYKEAGK